MRLQIQLKEVSGVFAYSSGLKTVLTPAIPARCVCSRLAMDPPTPVLNVIEEREGTNLTVDHQDPF